VRRELGESADDNELGSPGSAKDIPAYKTSSPGPNRQVHSYPDNYLASRVSENVAEQGNIASTVEIPRGSVHHNQNFCKVSVKREDLAYP